MFVLVAYDIANRKRLYRVAKLMEDYGTRVQRSVFECRLDADELAGLLMRVKDIIKKREDKVQIYHICETCQDRFARYGQGSLTASIDVVVC